jgi:2-methylisocitrate lyase-like PEP mutase family enzyme
MTREQKYEAFRALHLRAGAFVMPNPWNAGTARILTAMGFEALATTSAGYAFNAGRQDSFGGVTREDTLRNAKEIVDATHLPVSADLENGFGASPDECAQTIRLAAECGLAGGSIEDATGDPNDRIYPFDLAVERVAAAAKAARECRFVLTARAENFLHDRDDLDDTIRRLQAFERAGADVLYAPGLPGIEAIRAVCDAVTKPVNVLLGLQSAPYSLAEVAAVGVKRVTTGGSLARAALTGFVRAAEEIKAHGTFAYASQAISHADFTAYMQGVD